MKRSGSKIELLTNTALEVTEWDCIMFTTCCWSYSNTLVFVKSLTYILLAEASSFQIPYLSLCDQPMSKVVEQIPGSVLACSDINIKSLLPSKFPIHSPHTH